MLLVETYDREKIHLNAPNRIVCKRGCVFFIMLELNKLQGGAAKYL